MCIVLVPPGGYPIAVKYIISYQIQNVQYRSVGRNIFQPCNSRQKWFGIEPQKCLKQVNILKHQLILFVWDLSIFNLKKNVNLYCEILNILKDCYIPFTKLPICKPLDKFTAVSGKFHDLVLPREYTHKIVDILCSVDRAASRYNLCKQPTWRTVLFHACLFLFSTCFGQPCAHNQEN
jgi:hypothetical protein